MSRETQLARARPWALIAGFAAVVIVCTAGMPWMQTGLHLEGEAVDAPYQSRHDLTALDAPSVAGPRLSVAFAALGCLLVILALLGVTMGVSPLRWTIYLALALGLATWFAGHAWRLQGFGVRVRFGDSTAPATMVKLADQPALFIALGAGAAGVLASLLALAAVILDLSKREETESTP